MEAKENKKHDSFSKKTSELVKARKHALLL